VLQAGEYHYSVDSDGDVGGIWDDNFFYFFVMGQLQEIWNIRGRWHQWLPVEQRNELREVIDDWHREKLWPKGYTRVDDEGRVRVYAEIVVDWEPGVTDAQLAQTIRCATATSCEFFDHIAEHFGKA
jgi:hypothetical protein